MASILLDIQYAIRLLLKTPKFTALTLLVLIGGLTISLFTFSFLYTLVYKSLPLPEGDLIQRLSISIDGHGRQIPSYEYLQVREDITSYAEQSVYDDVQVRYSFNQAGKTIPASYVEPSLFSISRTEPILGRVIQATDMQPDANPVVVISYHTWKNEFKTDPDILGKSMRLNDVIHSIIGVMPNQYHFPINSRLWLPMPTKQLDTSPDANIKIQAFGRLIPGVSTEQAEQEIAEKVSSLYQQTAKLYNKPEGSVDARLMTFPRAQTDGEGNLIFTFFNLVAFFILLLACINVGNLLLARAFQRQKETAIRSALGAPIKRLTIQLMWEGILITLTGALLSVLLVAAILDFTDTFLHSYLPNGLSFWWHWGMDLPTLLMAGAFTLITILLAVFYPAWRSANQNVNDALRDGTRGAQSRKSGRLSRQLVTFQVFLITTLMLIGSISAFFSHYMLNFDFGIDYENAIYGAISLPQDSYDTPEKKINFYQQLIESLKAKDQVVDAVAEADFGKSEFSPEQLMNSAESQAITQIDTFALIGNTDFVGIKLLAGRNLDSRDTMNSRKTALISQSMAERYWPGENVLEKVISLKVKGKAQQFYVVGMTSNIPNSFTLNNDTSVEDEIYISGLQFPSSYQEILYKYQGENVAFAEELFYQALFTIDRSVEPYSLEPASQNRDLMLGAMKLTSNITFIAGGFALFLALTGIYGLTSNSVSQRTHEVGIRRAVGATDKQVISLFLRQGSRQLLIGLSSGLLVYGLIAYIFDNYSGSTIPNILFFILGIMVSIGLILVVMAAIYVPTRRAVEMEPSAALRYE